MVDLGGFEPMTLSAGRDALSKEQQKDKNMVDLVGIEPTTSSMPWKRAPNCATGPHGCLPILPDRG